MEARTPETTSPRLAKSPLYGYVVMSSVSLSVLLLVQLQSGRNLLLPLITALAGVLGIAAKMRLAPLLVFMCVALFQLVQQYQVFGRFEQEPGQPFRMGNVLICAATLGYVAAQYRLQALGRFVFPPDYRFRKLRKASRETGSATRAVAERKRASTTVTSAEVSSLAASLPLYTLAAQLAWQWLARPPIVLEWSPWVSRLSVFLLILAPGLMLSAWFLRYLRRQRMTREEALLFIQDTVWNETRGEHRWLSRWLAWLSLQRRENG